MIIISLPILLFSGTTQSGRQIKLFHIGRAPVRLISRRSYSWILACVSLLWASTLLGATIKVPADYTSIQLAVNQAVYGDTVLVSPGTYLESVTLSGKNIVVTSEDGAGTTIIEAPSALKAAFQRPIVYDSISARDLLNKQSLSSDAISGVIQLDDIGTTAEISGFTIRGGWQTRGIYGLNSSPTVRNCVIEECRG